MNKEITKHLDSQIEDLEKKKATLVRLRGQKDIPQETQKGYIDGLVKLSMVEHMFKNSKAKFEQGEEDDENV